ncbi:MAG: DUF1624 domain-containing protein [Azospirillum sp.]|nr:DUF1624 domain-containing protein [Azospirillum sp.]
MSVPNQSAAPARPAPDSIVPTGGERAAAVDALRGAALVAMIGYHLCWDLTFFGLAGFALFTDPFWLGLRNAILCSFLGLAGVSLVFGHRQGIRWPKAARRFAVLAACAAAITAASSIFFPDSPILFGVLHHLALAGLLGLAFVAVQAPITVMIAAAACVAAPWLLASPSFDGPWLNWTGLAAHEPTSNDFVPLLPWFAAVLTGIALARLMPEAASAALQVWRPASWPGGALAWIGRRSLMVYLLHQPILMGTLYLFISAFGIGVPGGTFRALPPPVANHAVEAPVVTPSAERFLGSCQVSCEKSGGNLALCAGYCRCVVLDLDGAGLWAPYIGDRLDAAGKQRLVSIVQSCAERQRAPP